ncbi:MAG: hypothetical protein ACK4TF_08315 [Thermodesulfovibrionales bacterium]
MKEELKAINLRMDQMVRDYKEGIKAINGPIDQIHTRLDQIMHMLTELRK